MMIIIIIIIIIYVWAVKYHEMIQAQWLKKLFTTLENTFHYLTLPSKVVTTSTTTFSIKGTVNPR
jgi:hypothetical protein